MYMCICIIILLYIINICYKSFSINIIQGFAYAHKSNPREICVHNEWPGWSGYFKIPTAIKYDKSFNLKSWGFPALAEQPNKKEKTCDIKPVEKFKLHLSKIENKPYLPKGLHFTTAITDYLKEMGKVMKDTLKTRWQKLDFFKQVLIIMTVKIYYYVL